MLPLLLTALFIVLNGFFVAAEFALVKLRATQLEQLARRSDAAARTVVAITHELDRYLSATQLGITLASLGLGWVGEPAIAGVLEGIAIRVGFAPTRLMHSVAFVVGFSALTAGHILFGELVPKLLAIQSALKIALAVGRPLRVFHWIMWPALVTINAAASLLLRALGFGSWRDAEGALSEDEILGILTQAYAKGRMSQPKRQLLERAMQFTDRTVRQVMVPRVDVTWLDVSLPMEQAMRRARSSGFTRYPLVEDGELDKIVGYLNVRDLVMVAQLPATLREVLREVLVVPETLGLFETMREMQGKQCPLAVVVDEYGGTSGIVTLEDVVEEIVGEIRDEFDKEAEAPKLEVRGDGSVVASGLVTLRDLREKNVDLGTHDVDTIGGAVLEELGRLARPGDVVQVGSYEIRVDSVRRRRVGTVIIRQKTGETVKPVAGD